MKSSKRIAVCSVFSALSVVLMFLGGIMYVFSYAVPIILALIILMVNRTFGKSSALTVYIVTAVLSLIIVTDKECTLLYTLFFGYYPIIKELVEKVKPKAFSIIVKLIIFNSALLIAELLTTFVFGIPFFEGDNHAKYIVILFTLAMNFIFVLFEYMLKIYYKLYIYRIEPKIKKLFK